MRALAEWSDRRQVWLYLASIVAGAALGLAAPSAAIGFEIAVTPVLAVLLFATFLGVPFAQLGAALRDVRFLAALLIVNFAVMPLVAWALSRFVAFDTALLVGALLVLLTPCVDYVVVFAGLAGGDRMRLLAATPLLMLVQMLLLPLYLSFMAGPGVVGAIPPEPFVEAFLVLIVAPLALAALVQIAARRWAWARAVMNAAAGLMVPLMMVTLLVVVGSQVAAVGAAIGQLLVVVPLFVMFVAVAVVAGMLAGKAARLDVSGIRAVAFSAATRNSLVVLPLALALPPAFALAPLVVVTQTLVELIAMVTLVALMPRLVPARPVT